MIPQFSRQVWIGLAVLVALALIFWPRRRGDGERPHWQRLDALPGRVVEALYTAVSWPYLIMLALTVNFLVRNDSVSQVAMMGSWAYVFARRTAPLAIQALGRNEIEGPGMPPRANGFEEVVYGREPDAGPVDADAVADDIDPTQP